MNRGRTTICKTWTREETLAFHDPLGQMDTSGSFQVTTGSPSINQVLQETEFVDSPKLTKNTN